MNILVVGCGKVGSRLAMSLEQDGHDVSVIDPNEENFDQLDEHFSGYTTTGLPIDQDVLKRAGIESCDALAAVSQNDNVNIMASQIASQIFHVPNVLARIYDTQRENVFSHLGLRTVCPTNLTVEAVRSALLEDSSVRVLHFGTHTISFHMLPVPKRFVGMACAEAARALDPSESLLAIQHADLSIDIAGKDNRHLTESDLMIVAKIID